MILKRLLCKLFGHKRGRNITMPAVALVSNKRDYQCPRCTETWTRKVWPKSKGIA